MSKYYALTEGGKVMIFPITDKAAQTIESVFSIIGTFWDTESGYRLVLGSGSM